MVYIGSDFMFDKFDNLGKILYVENVIFKDVIHDKISHLIDHNKGRPCLIISELDKMYLLPCTGSYNCNYNEHYFIPDNDDYVYNDLSKTTYIKLNKMIEREIFSNTFKAELTPIAYYKLLKELVNLYSKNNGYLNYEYYRIIEEDINNQIKKLEKILKNETI